MRRAGRSYLVGAFALTLLSLVGCSEDPDVVAKGVKGPAELAPGEDPLDPDKYPELGGIYQNLAALPSNEVSFDSGTLSLSPSSAVTIVVGKRAVDSAIVVNGVAVDGATSDTVKKLDIKSTASTDQVLILDFIGGLFAIGTATAPGITVDLGGGSSDFLRVRGSSAVDSYTVGADGIALNSDKFKDLTVDGVESISFTLAGGNDVFSASASQNGVTGPATTGTTVYGGAGNDIITGGASIDVIYGGAGNDTITGGVETVTVTDTLYGDDGVDTFDQGTLNDGADIIHCGDKAASAASALVEADVVTYGRRTAATISVSLDGVANDGLTDITMNVVEDDNILNDCEVITGGPGPDWLVGDPGNTVAKTAVILNGGAGADTLRGGAGADTLNGEAGDDTFVDPANTAGDIFNGGLGIDTVDYSNRSGVLTITMDGSAANDGEADEKDNVKADVENVKGGTLGDIITGNGANNRITGNGGADTLSGLAGNDIFDEGNATSGGDIFIGGADVDTVDYSARTIAITATMVGTAMLASADDGQASEGDDIRDDVENVIGTTANDAFVGNELDNTIDGNGGTDTWPNYSFNSTTLNGCLGGDDIVYNTGGNTIPANCEPIR